MAAMAARIPDEDGRNQERFAYDADSEPLTGKDGPLPEDPAIMDMGGLYGLASQAHAHYVLADRLSSNPFSLWSDPEHFAMGSTVAKGPLSFGTAMMSEHFMMALLAADPEDEAMSWWFLGNALHYLQDAADPLHTVQVGDPCILSKAFWAWSGKMVSSFGGVCGSLPGLADLAAGILSNHHLWVEAVWAALPIEAHQSVMSCDVVEPKWQVEPEAVLAMALDLTKETADSARGDAPDLYDAACNAASPMLGEAGIALQDGMFDWTVWVGADLEAMERVKILGGRSVQRAGMASRLLVGAWKRLLPWARTPEGRSAIVARLRAERNAAVAEREKRLNAYMAIYPDGIPQTWPDGFPWMFLVLAATVLFLGCLIIVLFRLVRRRNRAGSRKTSPS